MVTIILCEYEYLVCNELLLPLMCNNFDFFVDTQNGKLIVDAPISIVEELYRNEDLEHSYTFVEVNGEISYSYTKPSIKIMMANGANV